MVLILVLIWAANLPALAAQAFNLVPPVPEVLLFEGTDLVPLRPLAEILNGVLAQDAKTKVITLTCRGRTFTCKPHSTTAMQNGKPITLKVAPEEVNGALYLPLLPLVQALGGALRLEDAVAIVTFPGLAAPLHLPRLKSPVTVASSTRMVGISSPATELYLMNLDGSGLQRLTYTPLAGEDLPSFSADGRSMAYTRDFSLYVRKCDDPNELLLVKAKAHALLTSNPWVSPDGSTVFYQRFEETPDDLSSRSSIWRVDADGANSRKLADAFLCEMSPDGKYLSALIYDEQQRRVSMAVIDTDGKNLQIIEPEAGTPGSFSPDSTRLLYRKYDREHGDKVTISLAVCDLDGERAGTRHEATGEETSTGENIGRFNWNGTHIVFERFTGKRSPEDGIYLMNADRTGARQVLHLDEFAPTLACTPDGSILFCDEKGLFSVDAAGQNLRRLAPTLSPTGVMVTQDGWHLLLLAEPPTL